MPLDISADELIEKFKKSNPNIQIKDVYRLKRKVVNPDTKKVSYNDSESIKITIRTSSISPWIYFWKIRIPTAVFIPRMRMCFCCGLLNHITKVCRNSAKCLNCGENRHQETSNCNNPAKCLNCNDLHRTFAKECQEFAKRRDINRTMEIGRAFV